ncbi:hypothetical protein CEXT_678771 [Caerostris extrusa]|uniref:Uncharacterized protein n=1 Tax=Caerostris extrusa TaxID=172846 RepID=A0AAV4RVW1_CAEEX|nr:hypothetical protein CEXT_678771 [Caerostris extrusa]
MQAATMRRAKRRLHALLKRPRVNMEKNSKRSVALSFINYLTLQPQTPTLRHCPSRDSCRKASRATHTVQPEVTPSGSDVAHRKVTSAQSVRLGNKVSSSMEENQFSLGSRD